MTGLDFFIEQIIPLIIIVAGFVTIVSLIINAIVKVKIAKYSSLQSGTKPSDKKESIWPPPPSL